MCRIVGPQTAEQLLPWFCQLCEDGIWGVRKACTECFMEVSNSLTPDARRNELAQLFVGLLCDQSRWVRMSAFQALGPFISTFANPDMTGLYFDEDGILRVSHTELTCAPVELGQTEDSKQSQDFQIGIETGEDLEATDSCSTDESSARGDSLPESDEVPDIPEESGLSTEDSVTDCELSDMDTTGDSASELVVLEGPSVEEARCEHYKEVAKSTSSGDKEPSPEEAQSKHFKELAKTASPSDKSPLKPTTEGESGEANYGSFQYWRDPVPTLDLDAILVEVRQAGATSAPEQSSKESEEAASPQRTVDEELEALANHLETGLAINSKEPLEHTDRGGEGEHLLRAEIDESSEIEQVQSFMFGPLSTPQGYPLPFGAGRQTSRPTSVSSDLPSATAICHRREFSLGSSGGESNISLSEQLMSKQQDIIPPLLLENYLSMIDPSRAQTVDTDIAQHCAFSLPAVAFTLGRGNWKCLRGLYESLVNDMQWKVRRTLAFSIHEMAVILGSEITHRDLLPIFDGFIKDLDEVRIGVLAHLADFLKLLDTEHRHAYLPKLQEFMESDNNKVWRPREDLARQLRCMCDIYSADDVMEYMVPMCMKLLTDTVASIRTASLPLISGILGLMRESSQDRHRLMLINDLIEHLARSSKWHSRQTYVQACHKVLCDDSLKLEQFCKELLPTVLTLGSDRTPNVRIAVAKLLSQQLLPLEYFTSSQNPHHDDLVKIEASLKSDSDRDVKYYANLMPETLITHHDTIAV